MRIHLSDYPQLQGLAWNRRPGSLVDEAEAFALYRNPRDVHGKIMLINEEPEK